MADENPFKGIVQRAIPETTTHFLMLYHLPAGGTAGHLTTTSKTYYLSWVSPLDQVATYGVLNYLSKRHGRPMVYTYTKHATGFSMFGNSVIGYPSSTSTISSDRYVLNENNGTSIPGSTSYNVEIGGDGIGSIFQLEQINTNVPTDEIYSGVWYKMKINHNNVLPPVFDLPNNIGDHPFPHQQQMNITNNNNSLILDPWVTFIPYTKNVSVWTGGSCRPAESVNTSMLLYNDWILTQYSKGRNTVHESHFEQKHCYGTLGKNSKFCAYVGDSCNSGLGYNYCKVGKKCGECYGACDDGSCVWDASNSTSSDFYCSHVSNTSHSNTDTGITTVKNGQPIKKGGSKFPIVLAVGLFIFMMFIVIVFYFVGHKNSGFGPAPKSYNFDKLYH
jgi:hypothetical protein